MKMNELTPEERRIMLEKGTEFPYSGEYEKFFEEGIYSCRQCGAYLYRSSDKFDAHCGWPSFDDEVLGAVTRKIDSDGERTEIICSRCSGHLGHVFLGERMTEKNTRHCVNSLSLRFIPQKNLKDVVKSAYFGGGCFWCLEASFKMVKGVISVIPGYAGGSSENPTYEEVSTGFTGHAEMVEITYDSTIISYEALLEVLFFIHDPTTLNRQGNDIGTQYRSLVLVKDDLEEEIAQKFIAKLEKDKIYDNRIVTEVRRFEKFYEAEDYHRDYFENNPEQMYCQLIISPKLDKLRKNLKKYLRPA